MSKKSIIIPFMLFAIIASSCISENYTHCPNYSSYTVLFKDSTNLAQTKELTMNLFLSVAGAHFAPIGKLYTLKRENSTFHTKEQLRLLPGEYNYSALITTSPIPFTMAVPLQNETLYLYTSNLFSVKKAKENILYPKYQLANSMLVIKCLHKGTAPFIVERVELTPPVVKESILDMQMGSAVAERSVDEFFAKSTLDSLSGEWFYYCNPLTPGNELTLAITLLNPQSLVAKKLFTKVYLGDGLQQGVVTRITLDITPHHIKLLSTKLLNWEDHLFNEVIEL